MRLTTLSLATALGFGTLNMTTTGMAFGNHGGWGGNQFVRGAFSHPFHRRFHKTLVVPYAYFDYSYPTDAFGDTVPMTYPPPMASVIPPPTACHRNVETFTVASEGGGTRQITIINCP
jgi:hypothetical protein